MSISSHVAGFPFKRRPTNAQIIYVMPGTKSTSQLRYIFGVIRKLGLTEDSRKQMVISITNGRSESCADLSQNEAVAMCRLLDKMQKGKSGDQRKEIMRRKILSCFHEMNYRLPGGKLDMARVQQWLLKYGYLHKDLNAYEYTELPRLVTQVETMRDKHLNTLESKFKSHLNEI